MRDFINIIMESKSSIAYSSLPEDLRVLIDQLVLDRHDAVVESVPTILPLVGVRVEMISRQDLALDDEGSVYGDDETYDSDNGVDRGVLYAREMDLDATPPIVIADMAILDGRHRIWKAIQEGRTILAAIDLTGIVSPSLSRHGMAQLTPDALVRL